ncbi:Na+:solute symporter [Euzebyella marina]|uniref:Na+:solute symporter n=1 Tax=Euzebyella marina TaxID=1761453 RepID=A0A3G2LAG7_9FLAO|nr:sodium:solute symporter family protein [Euzebyella marina]AYN69239.1 Na+:solute symporter [Euzebyella marina]MBG47351.1 Na+:solute symporter [Pseudozobellia sp.]|tara:strand:- start:1840 stop:3315 length:1476 start_codon:yes stop_codon:yes gene_type:complete
MQLLDWIVLSCYFVMLLGIGLWAYFRVKSSADFYTAGGKLPWWLSGISHHVSGYSGAVFVAYAGIAYTHGFSLYVWWAFTVALATLLAAFFIAPRWSRLRIYTGIQSPTEYLLKRYNLKTQQLIAWTGALIKVFDTGGKLAAIAVLLNVFSGASITFGIILVGVISLIYITIGGLWADVWNDFGQFLVQLLAGMTMFVMILMKLDDGLSGIFTLWDRLPSDHSQLFNEPYTIGFVIVILIINFFSYSGGTWNLATRFISSGSGEVAKKAAILSSTLYFIWPLVLFYPMFASPLFFENLADPTLSYGMLVKEFLPTGLVGLVLASLFANTLSMTASDSNTVSAVISRDILPVLNPKIKEYDDAKRLRLARVTTFCFTVCTIITALNASHFGGVFGLIVSWFAALLGPISIPMILGLVPAFAKSNGRAALISIVGGLLTFIGLKIFPIDSFALEIGGPTLVSFFLFVIYGLFNDKKVPDEVRELHMNLSKEKN